MTQQPHTRGDLNTAKMDICFIVVMTQNPAAVARNAFGYQKGRANVSSAVYLKLKTLKVYLLFMGDSCMGDRHPPTFSVAYAGGRLI